ncbi:alkaline phosphatase D family protein [Lentisphaera marina]|uniref:alkaline phosphatase D family protein n=1 Tax=Lentisphaera marina TaxID=1111041 RepID=UPI002365C528|nr:alkaline phosphatase D family protein [Lentisphaera marina]MDD7985382.1 alkaline phosphatase D family protein [Lentisphaera marina]
MKFIITLILSIFCLHSQSLPSKIAFGSCGSQEKPMPILYKVTEHNADMFIYLGDNIYGDTKDMKVLENKYNKLGAREEFKHLKSKVPLIYATWDDHDYGKNDAGKEYSKKHESKEIFLNFWDGPQNSERRKSPGIFTSYYHKSDDKTLQVIVLDTRTFRDKHIRRNKKEKHPIWKHDYRPHEKPGHSFLGEQQWQWLQKELEKPADLRIIASSTQFGHDYNGYESWTLFPFERQKMLDLIKSTRAEGVIFISGDVHWGEISKLNEPGLYPLYDITSSGINKSWKSFEPNSVRIGEVYRENHFAMINIDWKQNDPSLKFSIIGLDGKKALVHKIKLSDLRFTK